MKKHSMKFYLNLGLAIIGSIGGCVAVGEAINFGVRASNNKGNIINKITYIDETDNKDAVDNIFEAEQATFIGHTSFGSEEYDHACSATSLYFNKEMHGGIAIRNIYNNELNLNDMSKLIFNINSNKNVEVKMEIAMSSVKPVSILEAQPTFSDLMILNVNGNNSAFNEVPPTSKRANSMCTVKPTIKLKEGENSIVLAVKKYNPFWLGIIDFINIKTTASLDFTPFIWKDIDINVESFPTETRFGKGILICKQCDRFVNCDLPNIKQGLNSGFYVSTVDPSNANKTNYVLAGDMNKFISSNPLPEISKHRLTIYDPSNMAAFYYYDEFGKRKIDTNVDVWYGHSMPEYFDNKINYHIVNWIDANTKEVVGNYDTFIMPPRDISITPIYAPDEYIKSGDLAKEGGINFFSSSITADYGSYKPFHSNPIATKGFVHKSLMQHINPSFVETNEVVVEGAEITYGEFVSGSGFTICADLFHAQHYQIEMVYYLQNKGSDLLDIRLNNTNSSSQAIQDNPTDGQMAKVVLNPGEGKIVVINMSHIDNANTLTGFRFNQGASNLKLGLACYVRQAR